jgi:hypothetical protein
MYTLGMVISVCAFLLTGALILRGRRTGLYKRFPLFYLYLIYVFVGTFSMYIIYGAFRQLYPTAYWLYYLVTILVEFTVLIEISDQIFRSFPAIRYLGRALAVLISTGFGLLYILPAIFWSANGHSVLLDFNLRASVTKAVILAVLFQTARHYGLQMERNVAGLILGFSIYATLNIALMASDKAFASRLVEAMLWFLEPLSFTLCLIVWTVSLWEPSPMPSLRTVSTAAGKESEAVALELARFNNALSKILHK